jgi:dihydroflavonol-4-reductase
VTDATAVRAAVQGVDVVFHVAAVATYWNSTREQLYRANVDGTRFVCEAACDAQVKRVVFTGTVAALGQPGFGETWDESASFNLTPEAFPYGHSKHLAEQEVERFTRDGLDAVTVSPVVIMGPRDINLIGGKIMLQAARTGIPAATPGGVGMVDVADVCAAHLRAAEVGRSGERYIVCGENLWQRDIARQANAAAGRTRMPVLVLGRRVTHALARAVGALPQRTQHKLPISADQLRYACETFWFSGDKARRELGIQTRPFAESAARTLAWYRDNGYLG